MPTTPPTIPAAPPVPVRKIKATFGDMVDAFNTWLASAVSQFNAVASNVNSNAAETATNATTASTAATTATDAAAAAVATANATLWVSGQSVAQYANKISPLDHQTYRRKTAAGSSTTDPALDPTNYVLVSVGSSAYTLLGTATVSAPVANIDFLSIFSGIYNKYVIEVEGAVSSTSAGLQMRFANGGAVDSTSTYSGVVAASTGQVGTTSNTYATLQNEASGTPTSLTIQVRNANSAGQVKSFSANGFSGTNVRILSDGGYPGGAISGFRLYWGSGNFVAGTIRVYGVRA